MKDITSSGLGPGTVEQIGMDLHGFESIRNGVTKLLQKTDTSTS